MKVALEVRQETTYTLKEILTVLKLPKSVYYYWIKHMDDQEQKDRWLVEKN
ncbi:hypothetical protein [Nosocomiicoccus ampullae]|uniref:hypothetical protein n=1 Tax=Nosocomiicoccus ampullae TaxID=489910 RepID=UPI001C5D4F8B|nr:hypothetical protein [Nosocomiicoccus ampullae]QYA48070.1 hypothetical protein KPF52_06535 [Nosocomiicoccus ampullae]QYA48420.1 hypothetical protein KPF52_08535 [Nosocomiicoccus ampullae]